MERRISKKIETFQVDFKNDIKKWLDEKEISILSDQNNKNINISDFLEFVFDYNTLKLDKEDFLKRKRIKNIVPNYERCIAKRACGEQCTRRRKDGCQYCGTHSKGTPHGVVKNNTAKEDDKVKVKVEIWVQEIKGINYYIDKNNNVYKPEDIIENNKTPQVIAKCEMDEKKNYYLPEFNN